jgi:hypothetical protein
MGAVGAFASTTRSRLSFISSSSVSSSRSDSALSISVSTASASRSSCVGSRYSTRARTTVGCGISKRCTGAQNLHIGCYTRVHGQAHRSGKEYTPFSARPRRPILPSARAHSRRQWRAWVCDRHRQRPPPQSWCSDRPERRRVHVWQRCTLSMAKQAIRKKNHSA